MHAGFLMSIAQVMLLLGIGFTEYNARQEYKDGGSPLRYVMFLAFAFCAGMTFHPDVISQFCRSEHRELD
jgi:hypothetical protein